MNVTAGMWDGVLAWITANEYLDELGDDRGGDDHDGVDHDGGDHDHDHHNHLHHDSRQDLWLVRKQNFLQKSRLESDWITRALMIAELGQTFSDPMTSLLAEPFSDEAGGLLTDGA